MAGNDNSQKEEQSRRHPRKGETLSSSADFRKELSEIRNDIREVYDTSWYKRMVSAPVDSEKLPLAMKIFGVLCILGALYGFGNVVWDLVDTIHAFQSGKMAAMGTSTTVVTFVFLADLILISLSVLLYGIGILRNQRRFAALIIYALYALLVLGVVCSIMLNGVSAYLILYGVLFGILIAFQVYLDPSLSDERKLQRMLRENEIRQEQEEGTLGRDASGKGYIDLNFFNLFWIFVVVCILGDGMETLYHYFVVVPGEWQDRAGLLFGPFSPIYGCGAILMTLFLNRLYKRNVIVIFLCSAVIGGAFEYFVSVWMQYAFGAVAWDYTGQWLSIDGRTCGWAMCAWGFLGVVWIKLLLPLLLRVVNLIPWNWRYAVTVVATVLMLADVVLTLESLDCWYERLAGEPITTPIQQFYADYFDNEYMANRFQSMTINPDNAVRQGSV
ncbi:MULTISPECIES: putative ABC transporter permease [unclassified Adlercreutzia]|uniref:putative ABC transporter permease n=1 Tax=unclassified Adlercreutzia TaxID=2636013 RepID=UPI001F14B1C7|nr:MULTISPECIES: putative ABC transporter permease [unclassified Adlercreutzia]